jgi:prepilin-type N-terminal cleavage/methylation domain-containing protein
MRDQIRVATTPWRSLDRDLADRPEGGFSLIELLIVSLVLPIVVGAITLSLISVFSLQGGVANRLSDSSDAQVVSANFDRDVQSASLITTYGTSTSPSPCETSTQVANADRQVLGLQWGSGGTGAVQTEVSYVEVPVGTSNNLVRNNCQIGSTTPVSSTVVSNNIASNQTASVTCSATAATECTGTTNYTNSWISSAGVTGVTFNITEPGSSGFTFKLVALPGASSPPSAQSTVSTPNSSCGFATPGTGTYASSLCFVDFSPYSQTPVPCPGSPTLQQISAPIANTPYTMTFCLQVTGTAVAPHVIPTYFAPPTSEAFLGNNGFYTGISGNPALYQTGSGTTTITITQIQVLDSNGNPATGWQLVSGDAESTDAGESIIWTSNVVLNPLWNSPTSEYGNACADPSLPGGVFLTGLGTTTVECAATVSSDKTGTLFLEAQTPSSLTAVMYGTGLEAMFVGLLLPS